MILHWFETTFLSLLYVFSFVCLDLWFQDAKSIVYSVLTEDKVLSKVCIPRFFQDVCCPWADLAGVQCRYSILLYWRKNKKKTKLFCPQSYPEQSLLLVVTGALGLRVLNSPLVPVLPVLNTFKVTSGSPVTPVTWCHVPCFYFVVYISAVYTLTNWSGQ